VLRDNDEQGRREVRRRWSVTPKDDTRSEIARRIRQRPNGFKPIKAIQGWRNVRRRLVGKIRFSHG